MEKEDEDEKEIGEVDEGTGVDDGTGVDKGKGVDEGTGLDEDTGVDDGTGVDEGTEIKIQEEEQRSVRPSRLYHNNLFKCIRIIWVYFKFTKFKITGKWLLTII